MAWVKLDDRYDDNPKVRRVWRRNPVCVGLHVMAVTYSSRHDLDGFIDDEWVEERLPTKKERERAIADLLDCGLLERGDGGYLVHDYLEFQPSSAERKAKREAGAKRTAKHRDTRRETSAGNGGVTGDVTHYTGVSNDSRAHARRRAPGLGGVVDDQEPSKNQVDAGANDSALIAVCQILNDSGVWGDLISPGAVESVSHLHPEVDLAEAAHLANAWAADSTWKVRSASASLRSAAKKLDEERQQITAKDERKSTDAQYDAMIEVLPA